MVLWELAPESYDDTYGYAKSRMDGHSGFVQDVQFSSDGQFGLSASWDTNLRLWDLSNGKCARRFVGHQKDALSCAFSADNRQIVSGGRVPELEVWDTLGECKYTITQDGHTDWISSVRFSSNPQIPLNVSAGWDKLVKVWSLSTLTLQSDLKGHTGYHNTTRDKK